MARQARDPPVPTRRPQIEPLLTAWHCRVSLTQATSHPVPWRAPAWHRTCAPRRDRIALLAVDCLPSAVGWLRPEQHHRPGGHAARQQSLPHRTVRHLAGGSSMKLHKLTTALAFGLCILSPKRVPKIARSVPSKLRCHKRRLRTFAAGSQQLAGPKRRPSQIGRRACSSRSSRNSSATGARITIGGRWRRSSMPCRSSSRRSTGSIYISSTFALVIRMPASHHHPWLAGFRYRAAQDHWSAHRPHRPRRKCAGRL